MEIRPVGYLDEVAKRLDGTAGEERYFFAGSDIIIKHNLVPLNNSSSERIVGKSYDGKPILGCPQAVAYEIIGLDPLYIGQRNKDLIKIRLLKIKED